MILGQILDISGGQSDKKIIIYWSQPMYKI